MGEVPGGGGGAANAENLGPQEFPLELAPWASQLRTQREIADGGAHAGLRLRLAPPLGPSAGLSERRSRRRCGRRQSIRRCFRRLGRGTNRWTPTRRGNTADRGARRQPPCPGPPCCA